MKYLSDILRDEQKKLNKKRIEVQLKCKHEAVVEAPYRPSCFGGAYCSPPFRVCKLCGFAEEGWHCGNQILKKVTEKMDRDDARRFVVGEIHNNSKFVRVGDTRGKKKLYKMAIEG